MNFLFKFFIFLGSVLVVALFAALIVPYFIDWDEFTSEFETQASRVVGQEVRVGGKTNLRLLPLPFLSFEELQVGRNTDGSPLMTVEKFSFNAELLPFLTGEVRIVEMAMQNPKVNLQVDDNGTIAWTNPTSAVVNPEQVKIEKLNIEGGSILVSGLVGKRQLQVDNINGNLSAKSILGPWRIDADADVEGVASRINIATGTFQDDDSLRLKMDLRRKDQPYTLLLDGPVKLEDDALSWDGQFRISQFLQTQEDTSVIPLPIYSSGAFMAVPSQIEISEYRLEVGAREDPYVITGKGLVTLDEEVFFNVQADGRQINIDTLKPDGETAEKITLDSRLSALQEILARVPVPTGKGNIDVILPAVVAGDTFIRNVKGQISPTGGGWEIKRLQANLPGNTAFEANGRLGLKNGFGFSGKVVIASRQPSGFADWVSGNVDETFRQLSSIGFEADATVTSRQATFENVELRLDDALLRGRLQRLSPQGDRAAIIAELKGNRVNLENLAALYSLTKTPEQERLTNDFNIMVKAETFEAKVFDRPLKAKDLDAHVQVRDGIVSIERLNASDLFGAKVGTIGRIENILSKPNGNMKLNLEAENAVELLGFAREFWGDNLVLDRLASNPRLSESTQLDFELDTTANEQGAKGRLLVIGTMGGSDVSLQIGFDGEVDDLTTLPLMIDGAFSNEAPSVLLQQIGFHTLPTDLTGEIAGGLKLDFSLSGVAKDGLDTRLYLSGPSVTASGAGKLVTNDWSGFDANLAVTLGTKDALPYIALIDVPVPGGIKNEALPLSATFTLDKKASEFSFRALEGQAAGNAFSGNLDVKQAQLARPRLSGDFEIEQVSLPFLAEAVFGRSSKLGMSLGVDDSISMDENSPFGEALFLGLDAAIDLSSDRLILSNSLVGEKAAFQLAMIDGGLDLNALTFTMLGGQFDGGLNLKNTAGNVLANFNYSMRNMNAGVFLNSIGLSDFASGAMTLDGAVETTGKSVAGLVSNLSGNGFVALKDGKVTGLNPDALGKILSATDVENYEISSDKIKKLFTESALDGEFEVSQFDTVFSVNRGKLRARNITHKSGETIFNSDFEYDLVADNLMAETLVGFQPKRRDQISGADPQGSISWRGPLASLERSVNTDRLEGYLSLRAFEASQRRLETLEAQVMEKQRLQKQIAYAFAKEQHEERVRLETEAAERERLRLLEEAKQREEERQEAEKQAAQRAAQAEALQQQQPETLPEAEVVPPVQPNIFKDIEDFLTTN